MHEGGHQQSDGVQCAAGVSVSMDKIVSCLQAQLTSQPQCCDVVVCSVNTRLCSVTRDQLSLTRDLWAADVRAYLSSTVQVGVSCVLNEWEYIRHPTAILYPLYYSIL